MTHREAAGQDPEGAKRPRRRTPFNYPLLKREIIGNLRRVRKRTASLGKGLKRRWLRTWIVPLHVKHLHGPKNIPYCSDELVVVCLVRDGRPYLKSFVEHYFALGVKHIILLDNGSTDDTVSAAQSYENVTILQTKLPFKEYKHSLRHYLIARFGKKGRWVLCVDQDELFDYPYSDVIGLSSFLKYLTERSYTAVVAQMLDMFPEQPVLHASAGEDEPLKELHRFYDISNVTKQDYYTSGGASNTLASADIRFYRDGINRPLFGHSGLLTKHPLIFLDDKIRPIHPHGHWVGRARVADITCVLFHYKFIGDFYERAVQLVREESHGPATRRYRRYLETLERNPKLQIKQETARELKGVNDLVDNRFLVVSRDYLAFVEAEERKKSEVADASQATKNRATGI